MQISQIPISSICHVISNLPPTIFTSLSDNCFLMTSTAFLFSSRMKSSVSVLSWSKSSCIPVRRSSTSSHTRSSTWRSIS
ncbi:hypothetical protein FJTKL_02563 [Diaporthe vaccinii]|uniref:F-box domain-containing protein n=1 Tax=Diaporthe vaccinii TaxID=105482 RepID=A0ABR4DXW6_9PEZI